MNKRAPRNAEAARRSHEAYDWKAIDTPEIIALGFSPDEVFGSSELAAYLDCSTETVRNYRVGHKYPYEDHHREPILTAGEDWFRVGVRCYFTPSALAKIERWLGRSWARGRKFGPGDYRTKPMGGYAHA